MEALLHQWLALAVEPAYRNQLLVAAGLLALTGLIARRIVQRGGSGDALSSAGLRRLAFPLSGWLLLAVARIVARHFGWPSAVLAVAAQLLLALALVRIAVFALRRAFSPSGWLASFERTLAVTIWTLVALDIVGLLPEVIAWLDDISLPIGKQKLTLWLILQGLATVFATVLAALWLGGLIEARLMRAPELDSSLKAVLSRVSKALLLVVAVMLGMSLVGLDLTTLSVFSGALGVGLGFGMQKIAANYVSGFIILLDRSIRIGNLISVEQQRGEVTEITTRYTVLRALNGVHHIVPNEVLVGSVVQNETYADPLMWISLPVQVSYRSDVERALAIMEACAIGHPRVAPDRPPRAFLSLFADSGINLELGIWIIDPLQGLLGVKSDINREIWRRFNAEGIEIPFPQREVRVVGASPTTVPPPSQVPIQTVAELGGA